MHVCFARGTCNATLHHLESESPQRLQVVLSGTTHNPCAPDYFTHADRALVCKEVPDPLLRVR